MTVRNLDALFRPTSVAVVGASSRPENLGGLVVRNLLRGGFEGPVLPVHPEHRSVAGVLAYPEVDALPLAPVLAVLATPPETVPGLVAALGKAGTRAVVVLAAGMRRPAGVGGRDLVAETLRAARPHFVRVLGPNCLGLLVPETGLNASFAHTQASAGRLAFLSQSGALCTAVLDWARSRGVGFSHFVSIGDGADVDVGDLLDYLGADPSARAILLYVEQVAHARKFMSAARAAARNKPVLVLKSGRVEAAARAAASHTGALAGSDAVYDAAFRRAGMLRVFEERELFDAAETLARTRPLPGERLAILTNGGGPGVMATDTLLTRGGRLAELAPETLRALDAALPSTWSRANPVDVIGDAPPERYAAALRALVEDSGVDAVLVIHALTATASSEEVARAVVDALAGASRAPGVFTCWLGRESVAAARSLLREAGIATYDTPGDAVQAFLHRVHYARGQEILLETPPSLPEGPPPDLEAARRVVEGPLAEGRAWLSEPEAKSVLAAYGIPCVETRVAAGPEEVARVADALGGPVAVKLLSPELTHKSDVGGVVLDLEDGRAAREAARGMAERLASLRPQARLDGFSVQRMARRPGAHELLVGAHTDPTFGPVVLFGRGGTAAELIADRAVGFPPLNAALARQLVDRTRVARLLGGYRDRPAVDRDALQTALVAVAQLVADLPEVTELDVNPLLADRHGVLALDARIRVRRAEGEGADRLAIRPYPKGLEEEARLESGERVTLRPIRPEDEPQHLDFFRHLDPDDVRFRFFGLVRAMAHTELARYTQIDYDREMAFIATRRGPQGPETLGVARAVQDPDNTQAEFAIVVRSDLKGQGLGSLLLDKLVRYVRSRGTPELVGQVLAENRRMLALARSQGFRVERIPGDEAVEVRRHLDGGGRRGARRRRR